MAGRLRDDPHEFNAIDPPPTEQEVREALDTVRPGLIADGGNVELVDVEEDGIVRIVLQGACSRCPAAEHTLSSVIEPRLKRLKGVTGVIAE